MALEFLTNLPSFMGRTIFPWLLPMLVCLIVGTMGLVALHRWVGPRFPMSWAGMGRWAFVAIATLFGLRILNLLFQILGLIGFGFRSSLVFLGLLTAACVLALYRWRKLWSALSAVPYPFAFRAVDAGARVSVA